MNVRYITSAIILVAVLVFSAGDAAAQETELRVVDEVVAQVNEGVITLSRIKREMDDAVDTFVQEGKTREEAKQIVESRRGELIAGIINEELIMQKAKELGLDSDVEAEVNRRFLQKMQEVNLKSLEKLYEEMRNAGVNPDEVRDLWRKQVTRDLVLQREVGGKLYWGLASKEIKDYFQKNKSKFLKPATVTLSEIFLNFAGRDENAVREKAKQLVAQLRQGADFEKLAIENSDRPDVARTKGKVDTFNIGCAYDGCLDEKFEKAVKDLPVGGVSDPVELDGIGIEILRVDAKTKASTEAEFDENAVRMAMTTERYPEAQKKFMISLRQDAFIKINDAYRPEVAPALFADDRETQARNADN